MLTSLTSKLTDPATSWAMATFIFPSTARNFRKSTMDIPLISSEIFFVSPGKSFADKASWVLALRGSAAAGVLVTALLSGAAIAGTPSAATNKTVTGTNFLKLFLVRKLVPVTVIREKYILFLTAP